jgi:hypothetical protein
MARLSHCGCSIDRDHNAAINIKNRAVGHPVLKAQLMSEAIAGVARSLHHTVLSWCRRMSQLMPGMRCAGTESGETTT